MSQRLGPHFDDPRCYYNDVRHKADWNGPYVDGVPALNLASTGENVVLPVMVLWYGIGSIDRHFLENDPSRLDAVRAVAEWMILAILPEGHYDVGVYTVDPTHDYYSNNSAMAQGLAISFATRTIRYGLVDKSLQARLREVLDRIVENMLLPVQQQGTALYEGDDLFFLEFCRKDHNVVLNGWIKAIFGLIDYLQFAENARVQTSLDATIDTMKRTLPQYCLRSGWSYYDNMGRISSPFYHEGHVALLDAMYRLTNETEFEKYRKVFAQADHRFNRLWYTLNKIKDKLCDKDVL